MPGGSVTIVKSSERVSRNSAWRSPASVQAIWSMIPTGAPTKSFSARLARRASGTSARSSAKASRNARSRATSSAALDDSPLPSGTRDSMRTSAPPNRNPSCFSAHVTPCT